MYVFVCTDCVSSRPRAPYGVRRRHRRRRRRSRNRCPTTTDGKLDEHAAAASVHEFVTTVRRTPRARHPRVETTTIYFNSTGGYECGLPRRQWRADRYSGVIPEAVQYGHGVRERTYIIVRRLRRWPPLLRRTVATRSYYLL